MQEYFSKKTAMCEKFVNLFKKRRIFTANGYNIYSVKGVFAYELRRLPTDCRKRANAKSF